MKRIVFVAIVALMAVCGVSAQEMYAPMKKFLQGCTYFRDAIETKDFGYLTDAKRALAQVKVEPFSEEDLHPADSISAANISEPTVVFNTTFANYLIKQGYFDDEMAAHMAHMMRKGDCDLQTWYGTIAPNSEATYRYLAVEDCELLLFAMSDANLELIVRNDKGEAVSSKPLQPNSVWYSSWQMPADPAEFTFTIVNHGKKASTFVVAIN